VDMLDEVRSSVITRPFHELLRPPLNHGPYLICSQITHYYIWVSPHGVYTIAMQLLFNHFSLSSPFLHGATIWTTPSYYLWLMTTLSPYRLDTITDSYHPIANHS